MSSPTREKQGYPIRKLFRVQARGRFEEFQGYRYSEQMVREIADLDLLTMTTRPARQVLLLETLEEPTATGLLSHLDAAGVKTRHEHVPAPDAWA